MTLFQRIAYGLALGLFITASGCGEQFPLAPVEGVITVDGEPLKNGHIGFNPIPAEGELNAGRPSRGKTDGNGRFILKTIDGLPGAVIGRHSVVIKKQPIDSPARGAIPAKYNDETELTFEVPKGGTDQANFDLITD